MFVFSALSNKPSHFFGVHDAAPPYWDNYIARQGILQSTVGRMQWDDPEAGRGLGKGRAGGGVRGGRFGPVLRAAKKTGGGAAMRCAGAGRNAERKISRGGLPGRPPGKAKLTEQ